MKDCFGEKENDNYKFASLLKPDTKLWEEKLRKTENKSDRFLTYAWYINDVLYSSCIQIGKYSLIAFAP